jgi:DNA-directed RNA polymerase specialized sigma24 family protein
MSKGAALLSPPDVATNERRHRFEELYAAHHASLLGYALRRTANTDDAADVLAETFLAAWRRLDDVPPGPQARLWLYGTARRVLANQRRGELRGSRWPTG